jgi:hypothetical protein
LARVVFRLVSFVSLAAFVTSARAAIVDFGAGASTVNIVSSFAPNPPGYFIQPVEKQSHVEVELDSNHDGVNGDVSLVSGTLYLTSRTQLGVIGALNVSEVFTLTGGTGTLTNHQILWNTPTNFSQAGTFSCEGGICGLFSLNPGQAYPIDLLTALAGQTFLNQVALGTWFLNFEDTKIELPFGGARAVFALGGNAPPPGAGLPAEWIEFTPEPGALALVLTAAAALALRRAGSHPAAR